MDNAICDAKTAQNAHICDSFLERHVFENIRNSFNRMKLEYILAKTLLCALVSLLIMCSKIKEVACHNMIINLVTVYSNKS